MGCMQHRGFHIDTAAHGRLLDALRHEMDVAIDAYAGAAAAASLDATLQVLPSTPAGKRELLEALLDGDELARWQRTPKSGELSTRRAELNRAAHYPPIRELVKANKIGKLLDTFGENWLAHVSPVTGRIHAAYRVAGAASGRATCAAPNVQQIPKDKRFRELFVAPAGCLLVCGDYASMELRAGAHISGDRDMTAARWPPGVHVQNQRRVGEAEDRTRLLGQRQARTAFSARGSLDCRFRLRCSVKGTSAFDPTRSFPRP